MFKRFQDLKPNSEGKISNNQLLEMNEFKFCPFKKFLPNALKLVTEDNYQQMSNKNTFLIGKSNTINGEDEANEINNKLTDLKKLGKNQNSKYINNNYLNKIDRSNTENSKEKLLLIDNNFKTKDSEINYLNKNSNNNLNGDVNVDVNYEPVNEHQYIDFSKFCEIMRVFNDKYPVDLKIICEF